MEIQRATDKPEMMDKERPVGNHFRLLNNYVKGLRVFFSTNGLLPMRILFFVTKYTLKSL